MTKIPTLYERLKPRVRAKLKENESKYSSSVREVIAKFESTYFIGDLTIEDIRRVHTLSDTSYADQSAISIIWGYEIFENNEESN